MIAADRSSDAYANADATRMYQLALDAARQLRTVTPAETLPVWIRLGDAFDRSGMFEEALDSYTRAYRITDQTPEHRARLLIKQARMREMMGEYSLALRDLTRTRKMLADLDTDQAQLVRTESQAQTAYVLLGQEHPVRASRAAREAAASARALGQEAMKPLSEALVVEGLCDVALHGASDGAELLEALAIFEQLDEPLMQANVKSNLGYVCAYAGRWKEAMRWLVESRELELRVGDTVGAGLTALNLTEMLLKQRRFDEAESLLTDVIRSLKAAHYDEGVCRAEMQLGRILIERGEFDQAEEMLRSAAENFDAAGQRLAALETTINRANGCAATASPSLPFS